MPRLTTRASTSGLPEERVVLPPIALLTVVGAAIAVRLYVGPLTTDDAYISLRYARNLVEGSGFVFNHGERVLGTTTPLFTLMLAAAGSMKLALETAAFVLPLLSDVTLITTLIVISYRSANAVAGAAAAAFIAVAPIYVTAATRPASKPNRSSGFGSMSGVHLRAAVDRSTSPCPAATEIGALGFSFPGRIIDLEGLIMPIALSIEPEELLERENAAWFVTQNIFMSPRIRDSDWFRREFVLVESDPIDSGRSVDTYMRMAAACP